MLTKLLSENEQRKLYNKIDSKNVELTAVCQIVSSKNNQKWSILSTGLLCLLVDSDRNNFTLKCIDFSNAKCMFEMEFFFEMKIIQKTAKFLTFDGFGERIGLSFVRENESKALKERLEKIQSAKKKMWDSENNKPKIKSNSNQTGKESNTISAGMDKRIDDTVNEAFLKLKQLY